MNKEKLLTVGVIASLALSATGVLLGTLSLVNKDKSEPNNIIYSTVKQAVQEKYDYCCDYVYFVRQIDYEEKASDKYVKTFCDGGHSDTYEEKPINVIIYEFRITQWGRNDTRTVYSTIAQCQEHPSNFKIESMQYV